MQTFNPQPITHCFKLLESAKKKKTLHINTDHLREVLRIIREELNRKTTKIGQIYRLFTSAVKLNNKSIKRDDLKISFYSQLNDYLTIVRTDISLFRTAPPTISVVTKRVAELAIQAVEELKSNVAHEWISDIEALRKRFNQKPPKIDKPKLKEALDLLCIGDGAKKVFDAIGNMLQMGENFGESLQKEAVLSLQLRR